MRVRLCGGLRGHIAMEVEILGRDGVVDAGEILLHVVEGFVPLAVGQFFRREAVDAPAGHAQHAQRLGVVRQVRQAGFDLAVPLDLAGQRELAQQLAQR